MLMAGIAEGKKERERGRQTKRVPCEPALGVQPRGLGQQRPGGRGGKDAAHAHCVPAPGVSLSQGRNGAGATLPILQSLGRDARAPGPSPAFRVAHLHRQVLRGVGLGRRSRSALLVIPAAAAFTRALPTAPGVGL